MIEFNKLSINGYFYVPLWEIKPLNNEELKSKYFIKLYQYGYRKSLIFKKISPNACIDLVTNTIFVMNSNKMINEESNLSFFSTYVNNKGNIEQIDNELVFEYFNDAKEMANQKMMILK